MKTVIYLGKNKRTFLILCNMWFSPRYYCHINLSFIPEIMSAPEKQPETGTRDKPRQAPVPRISTRERNRIRIESWCFLRQFRVFPSSPAGDWAAIPRLPLLPLGGLSRLATYFTSRCCCCCCRRVSPARPRSGRGRAMTQGSSRVDSCARPGQLCLVFRHAPRVRVCLYLRTNIRLYCACALMFYVLKRTEACFHKIILCLCLWGEYPSMETVETLIPGSVLPNKWPKLDT